MRIPLQPVCAAFVAMVFGACAGHQIARAQSAKPSAPSAQRAAPDPTESDGGKYRVVLENDHVRVLRYHDEPGEKTHLHYHPHAFVMYALKPFRRKLSFADGKVRERVFAADEADWLPAQTHSGENTGDAPTEGLLIEVKSCVR